MRAGRANRTRGLAAGGSAIKETVLGTKIVFKRKLDQYGRIEKYKHRLVAQDFRQVKGVHYVKSFFPTPAQASVRMAFGFIAILG